MEKFEGASRPSSMSTTTVRFERLVTPVLGDLYRFARRLAGPDDAEDLLQAAIERGLNALHGLRDDKAFKVWQSRLLFNLWRDRRAKVREFPSEHVDEIAIGATPSRPDHRLFTNELGERIHAALDAIPGDQADAVWLIDGEGYTYAEASEILGAPCGTVATRVMRGRLALRAALSTVAQEQGVA